MKKLLIVSALAAAFQIVPLAQAQTGDAHGFRRQQRHAKMLANLSPDERAKLRAAHQRAMADPGVQAAKDRQRQAAREFRELRRAKMIEADPSVQPILDKVRANSRGNS
ncbi:MAG: hypothetical protein M3032_13200 [Verrucomicrobiota bacterium]|nr:hypothetical protein [Verrucomicrobiota bacterium]